MSDKRGIGTLINDQIEMNSSRFDYFTPIVPENVLQSSTTLEINPNTNENPYEFHIPRDPEQFTDLTLTRLTGMINIVKLNANREVVPWENDDVVSVCNLLPHSLFKQVDVLIENTQVNDVSTATYPYKALIESTLSYNTDAKKTHLRCAGWEKDTPGQENTAGDANVGWVTRKAKAIGQNYYFNLKLHCDFLHSMKYLPPGLSLTLKLIRSDDEFSLIRGLLFTDTVRIDISKLKLQYTRIRTEPSFTKTIINNMSRQTALFPVTQSKIRTHLINAGTDRDTLTNIYTDVLPKTVLVGFLDRNAFTGVGTSNPFRFFNHKVNLLNLMINNVPYHPTRPFQPDYANNDFLREYINLFEETGMKQGNNIVDISMEDFKNNFCFYAFDLTPDKCNQEHAHAARNGNISIEFGFKEAPTENLYMVIYTTHRQTIEIDANKNVLVHD